jgi:GntR family phosphonate transport system transcriptional regulator
MTDHPELQLRRLVGVALWRQIQQILEEEISKGVHQPGEQLPTEAQLAERFSVNRHTVRRALAGLEEKGVVRVEQGRGTFVHEQVIDYRLGKRTRFTENLSSQSRSASGSLLEVSEEPADEKVAAALGLAVGTAVIRLLKVGEADGRRISISDHWYPAARCRGIDVHFRALQVLLQRGRHPGFSHQCRRHAQQREAIRQHENHAELRLRHRGRPPGECRGRHSV